MAHLVFLTSCRKLQSMLLSYTGRPKRSHKWSMRDHFNIGILYFTATASHLTYQHMSEDPLGCHVAFYFLKRKKKSGAKLPNQEHLHHGESSVTITPGRGDQGAAERKGLELAWDAKRQQQK